MNSYVINFPSHTPSYEYSTSVPSQPSLTGDFYTPDDGWIKSANWHEDVAVTCDSPQLSIFDGKLKAFLYSDYTYSVREDPDVPAGGIVQYEYKLDTFEYGWKIVSYGSEFPGVDEKIPAGENIELRIEARAPVTNSGTFVTSSIYSSSKAGTFRYTSTHPTYDVYLNDNHIGEVTDPRVEFKVEYKSDGFYVCKSTSGSSGTTLNCANASWLISGFKNLKDLNLMAINSGGSYTLIDVSDGECTLYDSDVASSGVMVADELLFAVQFNPALAWGTATSPYKIAYNKTSIDLSQKFLFGTYNAFNIKTAAGTTYVCSVSGYSYSVASSGSGNNYGMDVFGAQYLSNGSRFWSCVFPALFDAEVNSVSIKSLPKITEITPSESTIENGEIDATSGHIVTSDGYNYVTYEFEFPTDVNDYFRYLDCEVKRKNPANGIMVSIFPDTRLYGSWGRYSGNLVMNRCIPYATAGGYLASIDNPSRLLDKARLVRSGQEGFYRQPGRSSGSFNEYKMFLYGSEFTVPEFSSVVQYVGFAYNCYVYDDTQTVTDSMISPYLVLDDTYKSLVLPDASDFLECETADRTIGTYAGADYLAKLSDVVLEDSNGGYYAAQPISDFKFIDCDYNLLENLSGVGDDGLVTIDVVFFRGIQLLGTRCQELQTSRSGYLLPKGPSVWLMPASEGESFIAYGPTGDTVVSASFSNDYGCSFSVVDYWYTIDKTGYIWRNSDNKILHLKDDTVLLRGSLYDVDD